MPRRALVLLVVLVAGCDGASTALVVHVKTDYAPGREFIGVRTEYASAPLDGASSERTQESVATGADDFLTSERVAELTGVTPGTGYVRVTLLAPGGEGVAARQAIVAIEQRTAITIVVTRSCAGLRCPTAGDAPSLTECIGGACSDPRCAPEAPEHCPAGGCTSDRDCPDPAGCTVGRCAEGVCFEVPDDGACGVSEACDPTGACVEASADAGPTDTDAGPTDAATCPTAETACDDGADDDCDGLTDCADPDCDAAACDDGVWCNGDDACGGGTCSVHATPRCATGCDEAARACLDCAVDADCGAPSTGSWGACGGFTAPCGEVGTRSRDVMTPTCTAGACGVVPSVETEACGRTTEGTSCGSTTCPGWGSCGYSSTCDESATQSRTCTARECRSGSCASIGVPQSQACTRNTDGTSCGTTTCTSYGACNYSSTCDEAASQSRTCTSYTCGSGSCRSSSSPQSRSCTRSTDGNTCVAVPGCGARCADGACDPICSTGCPC